MNILILTGKFGMGHWSASQSLRLQLLRDLPGAEVTVEDFFAYALPDASETLYKCFSLLVTRGSGLYNLYYRAAGRAPLRARPPLEDFFQDKLGELLWERRPDAVIATHPYCAQLVSDYKEELGTGLPLATCITDLSSHREWLHPGADCYLVGSRSVRDQLIAKGVEAARIHVTGIPVRPQFQPSAGRGSRPQGDGTRRLLIMGGGLGMLPRRSGFYEALDALPGVETTLITGGNQRLCDKLAGRYRHIQVVGFTHRVYDYMAQADLMLSKPGGITLFETIFSELPILAWEPTLQQERDNARFLVRRAIGRLAPRDPEGCLQAIRGLLYDDGALSAMRAHMRALRGELEAQSLDRIVSALAAAKGVVRR